MGYSIEFKEAEDGKHNLHFTVPNGCQCLELFSPNEEEADSYLLIYPDGAAELFCCASEALEYANNWKPQEEN